MKKLKLMALVATLLVTMAQCKKQETPSSNEIEGEKVHITLEVDNGAKNFVHPETGTAFFTNGDEVLVANNGHYVGKLTYNSSNRHFDGYISGAVESDYLHFYFMGNQDLVEGTPTSSTTSFTVNISDQTNCYPQIAYAPSDVKYAGEMAYKACLLNQCALVKFTTNEIPVETVVTVSGLNNQVSVDLGSKEFSFSQTNGGNIALHAESATSRWAILLPQENISTLTASAEGYSGTTFDFPVSLICNNDYLTTGASFTMTALPEGMLSSLFSVSETQQVYFSQGNLQYIGSAATPYWKFADHQYDYFGNNGQISFDQNADRDLFCWGTSGVQGTATWYQPWQVESWPASNYRSDVTGGASLPQNLDWGVNIGDGTTWRTLTNTEWYYLLSHHTNGQATVCGNHGIVILPNDWTLPAGCSFNSGFDEDWGRNTYNSNQWAAMEAAGAVFLPKSGRYCIYEMGGDWEYEYASYSGYYWSATSSSSYNGYAYTWGFDSEEIYTTYYLIEGGDSRSNGYAVRLVHDKD